MTFGALVLVVLAWMRAGFAATESFGPIQWSVVGFLGLFGGALTFLLWSYALERTTPTLVAISVTINPIVSAIFGAYALNEPIAINLVLVLLLVAIGVLVASSTSKETAVRMG
jgi:drug/metabolite transporter (DMT)-like permease